MRIRKKETAWGLVALYVAWEAIGQPIWNLNVERVAEKANVDGTLAEFAPMTWIQDIAALLPSSFAAGFVTGGLIFAYWENIRAFVERRLWRVDEAANMRPWVARISTHIDSRESKISLFFHVVNVGRTSFRFVDVRGELSLSSMAPNGGRKEYILRGVHFEHTPTGRLIEPEHIACFSIAAQLPRELTQHGLEFLMWRPYPYLKFDGLDLTIENERGVKKRVPQWEMMRISMGEGHVRSDEAFQTGAGELEEHLKSALSALSRT